jgi:hypothetical protein
MGCAICAAAHEIECVHPLCIFHRLQRIRCCNRYAVHKEDLRPFMGEKLFSQIIQSGRFGKHEEMSSLLLPLRNYASSRIVTRNQVSGTDLLRKPGERAAILAKVGNEFIMKWRSRGENRYAAVSLVGSFYCNVVGVQ